MSTFEIPYVNVNQQLFGKLSGSVTMGRPRGDRHTKLGEITETATIILDDKVYTLADIGEDIKDDTILYRIGNIVYCIPLQLENVTTTTPITTAASNVTTTTTAASNVTTTAAIATTTTTNVTINGGITMIGMTF